MLSDADALALAHGERCRRLAVRAGEVARAAGLRLLAIKGVTLAFGLAERPWQRPMVDADVLAEEGTFGAVLSRLRASGAFTQVSARSLDASFGAVPFAFEGTVDVHAAVLPAGCGGPTSKDLFARAQPGPRALAPLLVPDPTDGAVIALLHWAKDGFGVFGPGSLTRDLRLFAERAGVTPQGLAERLRASGSRRVGAVAFLRLGGAEKGSPWAPWLAACEPSVVEETVALRLVPSRAYRRGVGVSRLALLGALRDDATPVRGALRGGARGLSLGLAGAAERARRTPFVSLLTKLLPGG